MKESYTDRGCEYTIGGPDYNSMDDETFGLYMKTDLNDILTVVKNKECEMDVVVRWTFELADKIFERKRFLERKNAK